MKIASIYHSFIHQIHARTACLIGDLDDEIYMEQPKGFILFGNKNKVSKLIKSLFGLKQAPKY